MRVRFHFKAIPTVALACGLAVSLVAGCQGEGGDSIAQVVDAVRELFRPPTGDATGPGESIARSDASAAAPAAEAAPAATDGTPQVEAVKTGARSMDSIAPEDAIRVYYQFIDDRGQVRFVERLADVPSAWRDRVGYVEMSSPPPLTPADARKTWQADPEAVRRKTIELASTQTERNPNHGPSLILYSADWCGYCKLAKRHLDEAGYAYDERDVDRPAVAEELREKTGRGGIPVLDAEGEILRGYRKDQYDRFLREI